MRVSTTSFANSRIDGSVALVGDGVSPAPITSSMNIMSSRTEDMMDVAGTL
jgi:hypothetical protein